MNTRIGTKSYSTDNALYCDRYNQKGIILDKDTLAEIPVVYIVTLYQKERTKEYFIHCAAWLSSDNVSRETIIPLGNHEPDALTKIKAAELGAMRLAVKFRRVE